MGYFLNSTGHMRANIIRGDMGHGHSSDKLRDIGIY